MPRCGSCGRYRPAPGARVDGSWSFGVLCLGCSDLAGWLLCRGTQEHKKELQAVKEALAKARDEVEAQRKVR